MVGRTFRLMVICCALLLGCTMVFVSMAPSSAGAAQIDPTLAAINADGLRRQGELAVTASIARQATSQAQATVFALQVQATAMAMALQAQATGTAMARADEIHVAQVTAQAQATATANANATATEQAQAIATANANATATEQAQVMETTIAEATQLSAQATRSYVAFQENARRQRENIAIGTRAAFLVSVFLLLLIGFRLYQIMKPGTTKAAESKNTGDEGVPTVPEADQIDVQLNDDAMLEVLNVLEGEGIRPQAEE
jgi:hypothetical protein